MLLAGSGQQLPPPVLMSRTFRFGFPHAFLEPTDRLSERLAEFWEPLRTEENQRNRRTTSEWTGCSAPSNML
jgi:hypothetical protein